MSAFFSAVASCLMGFFCSLLICPRVVGTIVNTFCGIHSCARVPNPFEVPSLNPKKINVCTIHPCESVKNGPATQQHSPTKPPANQLHNYEKIYGEYNAGDIEIVCAGFHLQSDGKLPEPVCKQTDTWLRTAARSSPRAVLALSYPNSDEVSKQSGFRKRR